MAVEVRIPGVNGAGDQVFTAETHEQLVEKLRVAQENGTSKIRELNEEKVRLEEQLLASQQHQVQPAQQQVTDGQFDRQKYFTMMYDNPLDAMAYGMKHMLGRDPREFAAEYDQVRQGALYAQTQAVNAAFVQRHPELLQVTPDDDKTNAGVIAKIITERGWRYDVENLEAAYQLAKANRQLKLPEAQMQTTTTSATSIDITKPLITATQPGAAPDASEQEAKFLQSAPLNEVRDYLERKYKGQSPFVPTTL